MSESEESQVGSESQGDEALVSKTVRLGFLEVVVWFVGLGGVLLMLSHEGTYFWLGLLLYLIYLAEMCCSKHCAYLSNVQSQSHFVHYIKSLQESSPIIEFHIQNYHNKETRTTRDGQEKTAYERVNTHRACEAFPFAGFSDETMSPDQMIAMFNLLYHKGVGEDASVLHDTAIHADTGDKKLILTCKFPLTILPRDDATARAMEGFKQDFYRRHTTDTYQDKKEKHYLSTQHHKHVLVVMSSAGTRDTSKPWWMSRLWYVLSHLCFLGLPFRCYLSSQTQEVLWPVRKHITILRQLQGKPMHALKPTASLQVANDGHGSVLLEEEEPLMDLEASLAPSTPNYWKNLNPSEDFNCMELLNDSSDEMHGIIQKLLDECFLPRATRDRVGRMPRRLAVELVQRLEHRGLWARYAEKRRRMQRRGPVTLLEQMEGSGRSKTSRALGRLNERLLADVNELYLFHGSSPAGVLGIGRGGFDLGLSGAGMFGPGAYFAEASSKSDEYATEDPSGLFSSKCALLLCRVLCGALWRIEHSDPSATKEAVAQNFDSVLGDREHAVGSYREFVVCNEAQVYPEYVVIYRREF